MALGNTPRGETSIAVEANKSYAFGVLFRNDPDEPPLDLAQATLRFVATEGSYGGGAEVLSKVATPMFGVVNMQQFEFQAEDLAITPGSYSYDVTLIPVSGYSIPLLKGNLEIGMNADQDVSNVYSDITTGTDIIVDLVGQDVVEVTVEREDGLFNQVKEMVDNFQKQLVAATTVMNNSVTAAATSANSAKAEADKLRGWFQSVGFPFWKGTQADYNALSPKDPNVLYLIIA